jgi:N-acetylglucosaminyldiphosphoundecaprenol N-acetyl-beta-D-mannosaminyltransferase
MSQVKRVNLLGVGVHPVDMKATMDAMAASIQSDRTGYICLAPAHNLMACRSDPTLRGIFNRSMLTVPDGVGTVWFLRFLGHKAERVYGPDLMLKICERGASSGWRHFFLGGKPEVAERLVERLLAQFPTLQVAGKFSPPFRKMTPAELDGMIGAINASKVDFLWVGLGSPKQEHWMSEMRERLDSKILVGVGAAFDFVSGTKAQAPKWIQRAGLEWLFRLMSEPRRLWRRYSAYPLFVALALSQLLGLHRYPLEESS